MVYQLFIVINEAEHVNEPEIIDDEL